MERETLFNRKYKEISVCQLDGCNIPILKKTKNKRNKYCCDEHAKIAREMYRKVWRDLNRDKIRKYNQKYQDSLRPLKEKIKSLERKVKKLERD